MGCLGLLKGEQMTKQDLKNYYWLQHEIKQQKGRLARLRKREERSGEVVGDIVSDYKTGKAIPLLIRGIPATDFELPIMIRLLETEIEKNITEAQRLVKEIEKYIQTVNDPRMRELLRSRFIDCLSWEQVGKANHINQDHARKLLRNFMKN